MKEVRGQFHNHLMACDFKPCLAHPRRRPLVCTLPPSLPWTQVHPHSLPVNSFHAHLVVALFSSIRCMYATPLLTRGGCSQFKWLARGGSVLSPLQLAARHVNDKVQP